MGCDLIMDPKRGKASPVSDCSSNLDGSMRGRSLKSNPFCPGSSSRLTQSIIKDHMVSHYKKIYSAKAAIDATIPKSMICSVKYNDQLKREQLRSGSRPQSAHSVLQRNGRTSCSSRGSQGENSPFFCSESSITSSPRHNTSFNVKQIVYPSIGSGRHGHHTSIASESSYGRSETDLYGQHSTLSSATSGHQSNYKTFKDPFQNTYSGDLLQKHSHCFTHDKPFTPRTLKSDKSSSLSKYRYYMPPKRNPYQNPPNPRLMRSQTYHGSTQLEEHSTPEYDDVPQGFSTDHSCSEDESIDQNGSVAIKQRASESILFPSMMRTFAEAEELIYLEFIVDVTNDILSRGLFSDRVLDRVFERHIDKNRHRLNEDKMRHLLEVLRNDFEEPGNTPISSADVATEENASLRKHLSSLESVISRPETKADGDLFHYASLITNNDSPMNALSPSIPLHCSSPERTDSPIYISTQNLGEFQFVKENVPDWFHDNADKYTGINDEDLDQKEETKSNISQESHPVLAVDQCSHLDPVKENCDGLSEELEDLGRHLSESLHVTKGSDQGVVKDTSSSLSDDEF